MVFPVAVRPACQALPELLQDAGNSSQAGGLAPEPPHSPRRTGRSRQLNQQQVTPSASSLPSSFPCSLLLLPFLSLSLSPCCCAGAGAPPWVRSSQLVHGRPHHQIELRRSCCKPPAALPTTTSSSSPESLSEDAWSSKSINRSGSGQRSQEANPHALICASSSSPWPSFGTSRHGHRSQYPPIVPKAFGV